MPFSAMVEFTEVLESESDRRARTIQRYLVTDIVYGHYAVADHAMQPEKVPHYFSTQVSTDEH